MMKIEGKQVWAETLRDIAKKRSVQSQELIFDQGETLTMVGLVLTGTAKGVVYSEDGQETWIENFGRGDFFGHEAIFSGLDLNMSIIAETEFSFLSIPAARFETLFAEETNLLTALAQDLAQRLAMMTQRLVEAFTLTSPGRVCAELMRLSKPIGVKPGKNIVRPNPVFAQLASRISSTRETVSRTVSDLQKKGIISRETGAIVIHEPDELRKLIK